MIAIIDYGVGNLRSIEKAFAATGSRAVISNDPSVLRGARALVLPGVGAFAACMRALSENDLDELLLERVAQGVPLLGVCVGMQMLFQESEEFGSTAGLGLLPGRVRRFSDSLTVPHVGWNHVRSLRTHPLMEGIGEQAFFYFVHSYYCVSERDELVLGETDYGEAFTSIVASENICGVQFHPEKSQLPGLR
ncbi:MAG TPA: imidazole glycerol phosphate synthase subunit HisH, partial [Pyrinomonadaceae bacterium]|nr:imidazole glycerol phosphate synthase subunit HisH [Pyrinomonadaceae bacterium]